ncbi:MAG: glycosyltransferase family 9 protein [Deltaproteobacteria bacterium]
MRERILVTQPYGLGDAVFMLPFLKALRACKEVERLDVILGHRTREILENSGLIDDIYVIDKDLWKARGRWFALRDKLRLFKALRRRRYSIFVDLSMQPEYGFWAKYLLGIPVRAGFNYKRRNRFLNRPLNLPLEGFQGKHMIEFFAELAGLLDCRLEDLRPRLPVSQELSAAVAVDLLKPAGIGGRYAVVAPGGGVTWGLDARYKHWPVASFAELLRLLRDRGFFDGVVVLGAEHESAIGAMLEMSLDGPVANLCGRTGIMQAVAICKGARIFIGNDGGLVHLAATQDIPLVAFYGPADPLVYGPFPRRKDALEISKRLECQPCYKGFRYNKACARIACLNDLSPQDVLAEMIRRSIV